MEGSPGQPGGLASQEETTRHQMHPAAEGALKSSFHSLRKCIVNRAERTPFPGGQVPSLPKVVLAGLTTRLLPLPPPMPVHNLGGGAGRQGPARQGSSSLWLAGIVVALTGSGEGLGPPLCICVDPASRAGGMGSKAAPSVWRPGAPSTWMAGGSQASFP